MHSPKLLFCHFLNIYYLILSLMLSSEPSFYRIYNMFIIIYVLLVVIAIYCVLFFFLNIFIFIQLFRKTLSEKSTKLHKPISKGSMGGRIELLLVLHTNGI